MIVSAFLEFCVTLAVVFIVAFVTTIALHAVRDVAAVIWAKLWGRR